MAELYYYVEATHGAGQQPGMGEGRNGRGALRSGCAKAIVRSGGERQGVTPRLW